jgi:hypothetical protein
VALTAAALELTGRDPAAATATAEEVLDSGQALERFRAFVAAQGGEPGVADDPWALLPGAPVVEAWRPGAGHVSVTGCRRLGELAGRLGAGRRRAGDALDLAVGLEVLVRTGDEIDATPSPSGSTRAPRPMPRRCWPSSPRWWRSAPSPSRRRRCCTAASGWAEPRAGNDGSQHQDLEVVDPLRWPARRGSSVQGDGACGRPALGRVGQRALGQAEAVGLSDR